MDPSGPWAYTYNRIAVTGVSSPSSTTASSDYQQQQNLTTSIAGQTVVSGPSPTSSTILLQTSNPSDVGSSGSSFNSGGYITSTPVSYDQVFNPIFQQSGPKPAHYNSSINSHRQNLGSVQIVGATEKSESSQQNFTNHGQQQQQNFYAEQSSAASPSPSTSLVSTWRSGNVSHISVGDPFSILSQDSVVQATSPVSSGQQNNYGTQYQTPQSQLNQLKVSTRSSSPQVVGGAKTTIQSVPSPIAAVTVASSGIQTPTQYYRQSSNIATSYSDSSAQTGNVINSSKSFSTVNPSSLNQTCILVTTSPAGQGVPAQNVSTQKYAKKQNMYNNATRNSAGKSGNVIGQQNLVITNNGNNFNSPTSVKPNNHTLQLVQTKAQSKIYNEIVFVDEQDRAKFAEIHQAEGPDGTVSYYTILDGRLAYATSANANLIINESPKGRTMSNIQSPRQFVLSNTAGMVASDGSTIKTEPDYVSGLQSECATSTIIVPRKQSPSHSASSQAPSPAYPIYNSPMNSIESPSQHSASSGATHSSSENSGHIVIYKSNTPNQTQIATQSALDSSSNSRVTANNTLTNPSGPVVYSSVITRALVNEPGKVYSPQQTCWDNDVKPKKYFTINSGVQNEIVVPAEIQIKPAYYDPSVNSSQLGALHGLKTEEPQVTENILVTSDNPLSSQIQITQKLEEPPRSSPVSVQQQQPPPSQPHPPAKTRRRRNQNSTKTREQLLSENEFLINRVPPVAHVAKGNAPVQHEMTGNVIIQQVQATQSLPQQQQQHNGGSYYENRWNVGQQTIVGGTQSISNQIQNYASPQQLQSQHQHSQQQQTILSHQHSSHTQFNPQSAYYSSYQISPPAPSQIMHSSPTTIVETSTSSAEAQAQSMLESGAQILAQLASSSEAISAPKETSNTHAVNPDEPSLKVVVPNIEEELEFLAGEPVKVNKSKTTVANINPVLKTTPRDEPMQGRTFKVPNSAATGFMASYLKFLQGERDGSPPPLGKTQRKSIYHQKTSQSTAAAVINSTHTSSKNLPTAAVQSNKTAEQSGSLPALTITQTGLSTSSNRMQQQNRRPIQQITSSACPDQPMLATALTAAPSSSTTIITNYASTQPINKKRKAVALATEIEQNKQKKTNNKTKNVTETAVQTTSHPVMLPKKARPQMAMQMASMQQTLNKPVNVVHSTESIIIKQEPQQTIITTPGTVSQSQDPFTYQYLQKQVQHQQQQMPATGPQQQQQQQAQKQIHQRSDEDPLNLPPRRETSLRKAKTRGIEEIMQKSFENDDVEEPLEFIDSDTDPVWTPEDEENELNKAGKTIKRKGKKTKISYSRSRKAFSNILTAAVMGAGIDDSDADNNAAAATATTNDVKVERIEVIATENSRKQIYSPKGLKQEAIKQEAGPVAVSTTKVVVDFKTGDFVVVRADLIKDWPVIWQVDGKQILQMFEPFHKDGQILYRNMSKYAAWNNESKRLYVRAPVKIRSQSQNEFIVELNKSELYGNDIEQFAQKLLVEYLKYRENFDVYIQTLISQSLDRNFFTEITKEKDEYFLSNIKVIDDIMENCKKKLQLITPLSQQIIVSLETWPHFNVMIESSHTGRSQSLICSSCRFGGYVRFLLYGQPYNPVTMVQVEPDPNVNFEKDVIFCLSCESRIKRLHKITHEKYNLYQICLRKVQEQQLIDPTKGTTAILNDLLAESDWIDQLFANVRNAWAEIECLDKIVRFYQVSQ